MPTEEIFETSRPGFKAEIKEDIPWNQDSLYRGFSWEDYILEGGYDTLWDGDYGQQIMQNVLYARSFSKPPINHLFTFPVKIVPPETLPGATILNINSNFIDGGTWLLGSKIRVVWEGTDGRRAYRDYNVKRFQLSMVQSDPGAFEELFEYVSSIVQAITPDEIQNVFELLQSSTLNKLGIIQPGNTIIYTPSLDEPDRSGYLGRGRGSNNRNTPQSKSAIPWLLIAAIGAKLLL